MLRLVRLNEQNYPLLCEMMEEWTKADERIIPYAIRRNDYRDYDFYSQNLDVLTPKDGLVPDHTLFCLDEARGRFVGAVNIRHYLNERLLLDGGHIGDGVRPSERGKGIGTRLVALALEECRNMGIMRVLMVCDKDNIASAKTIEHNGGVKENELEVDGTVVCRYWIELE